jgi:hypothetical protein
MHGAGGRAVRKAVRPQGTQFVAFAIAADEPVGQLTRRLQSSSVELAWEDSLRYGRGNRLTVVGLEALNEAFLPFFTLPVAEPKVYRHGQPTWLDRRSSILPPMFVHVDTLMSFS